MVGWTPGGMPFLKDSFSKVIRRPPCVSARSIRPDFVLKAAYTPLWAGSIEIRFEFLKAAYTPLFFKFGGRLRQGGAGMIDM